MSQHVMTHACRCVLLSSPRQDRFIHDQALLAWKRLAEDEEKDIIYASVDVDANKKVGGSLHPSSLV